MRKKVRLGVDICMIVLLPLIMAYSLIGEMFHEIAGTAIFILFVIHHILNRKWSASVFKGKYRAERIFRTVINVLLFAFMILQPVSGILMSKHLYVFLPDLSVSAQARAIHMLLAYWGFVFMCIHAGTHMAAVFGNIKNRTGAYAALAAVSAYGCYAFVKRGFPAYMTGRTMFAFFDFGEPAVFFVLDHAAVMILFMAAGFLAVMFLRRSGRKTAET